MFANKSLVVTNEKKDDYLREALLCYLGEILSNVIFSVKTSQKHAFTDYHSSSRYSQISSATQYMYICIEEKMWLCTMLMVNVEVDFIYRCIMYLVLHHPYL